MTTTHHPKAAAHSLRGLALGDGFGERWFFRGNAEAIAMIKDRMISATTPWHWTDDTAMALALLRVLMVCGEIDQQQLASSFAAMHATNPHRGYGYGMHQLLPRLAEDPGNWPTHARTLFNGQGSLGNGAAMRVAPLGAWFHSNLDRVVEQAALSAEVTHAHPEGVAGAVAVAVAAAIAADSTAASDIAADPTTTPDIPADPTTTPDIPADPTTTPDIPADPTTTPDPTAAPNPADFLRTIAMRTPPGAIRDGLLTAAELPGDTPAWKASDILGNGQRIRASDTVPFALWSAAHHLDSLVDALWTTAEGLGDVDTTCAITGGVVAARTGLDGVPMRWIELCEELPDWVESL